MMVKTIADDRIMEKKMTRQIVCATERLPLDIDDTLKCNVM